MKLLSIILFAFFTLASYESEAQRYLTPQFSQVDVASNVQYGESTTYQGVTQVLMLDIYAPSGDTATDRPLLIYAHGGGFVDQAQTKNLPHIQNYCDSLARRGYVVASIDYRLDELICNRAVVNAMHDMRAAIRYFRSQASTFGINPDLIFISGESAGAITALNAGYIDTEGEPILVSDNPIAMDLSVEGMSGNPGVSSAVKAVLSLCGGTMVTGQGLVFDTLTMSTPDDPPLVIVHGSSDGFIPITSALDLELRAQHIGLPSLFFLLEDATHCPWFTSLPDASAYMDTLISSTVPFMYACTESVVDGVGENELNPAFELSPNPTQDMITITIGDFSFKTYAIQTSDGKQVKEGLLQREGGKYPIDVSGLPSGRYLLTLFNERISRSRWLIKE